MKKEYQKPEAEYVDFSAEEEITAPALEPGLSDPEEGWE